MKSKYYLIKSILHKPFASGRALCSFYRDGRWIGFDLAGMEEVDFDKYEFYRDMTFKKGYALGVEKRK